MNMMTTRIEANGTIAMLTGAELDLIGGGVAWGQVAHAAFQGLVVGGIAGAAGGAAVGAAAGGVGAGPGALAGGAGGAISGAIYEAGITVWDTWNQ